AVAVDSSGNVLISGFFQDGVSFGGATLNSTYGSYDSFVAKLAGADGSHSWSENFNAPSDDLGQGIAVDSDNNVLITGLFAGPMTFGSIPLGGNSSNQSIY